MGIKIEICTEENAFVILKAIEKRMVSLSNVRDKIISEFPQFKKSDFALSEIEIKKMVRKTFFPQEKKILLAILDGCKTKEEIATKIGSPLLSVMTMCNSIKKITGIEYMNIKELKEWVLKHGIPLHEPKQSPCSKPKQIMPVVSKAVNKSIEEAENSNAGLSPIHEAAIKLGLSIPEPFTSTDLSARLDASRNGQTSNDRASQWLVVWHRQNWIEMMGFRQYRRTEKFGKTVKTSKSSLT